jgi:hypothetical protein
LGEIRGIGRPDPEAAANPHRSSPLAPAPEAACCSSGPGGCSGTTRREFFQVIGLGAAAVLATQQPVMAGPFDASDFEALGPADKKLDPAWVISLTARGEPTVYRGADLGTIGMPIGGICAGQLYLGGDGTLWHWDIFNRPIATNDSHYAHPMQPTSPLDQGFALKITTGDASVVRPLSRKGPLSRARTAGNRVARGVLAVRPSQCRRVELASDRSSFHGEEHIGRLGRSGISRLARKRRLP